MERTRCAWGESSLLYVTYHDEEWGVPEHGESRLFEMLVLEGAQAGLNWLTILKKRSSYRAAFDQFDPAQVARYDDAKSPRCWPIGHYPHRLKVNAAIQNARASSRCRGGIREFRRLYLAFRGRAAKEERLDGNAPDSGADARSGSHEQGPERSAVSPSSARRSAMRYAGVRSGHDHVVTCFRYDEV